MNDERRRVNQKLAYAGWALHDAGAGGSGSPPAREAAVEAVIFHLVGAYRAFLAEIISDEHVRRPAKAVPADSAVVTASGWPDYLPPALAELVSLEQSGAWPAQLLGAWQWACRRAEAPSPSAGGDVIALVSVSGSSAVPSLGDCRRWFEALQALVERLRDDMQEW